MKDLAYTYFKKATKEWLARNSKTQNWLALELGVEDGTISRYLSDKREIPFARQLEIANKCGCEYLTFLQFGKDLIEKNGKPSSPEPNPETKTEVETETEEGSMKELAALVAELSRENRKIAAEKQDLAVRVKELEMQLQGMNRAPGSNGQTRDPQKIAKGKT